ncbi:thioredoxin-like protein [Coniella lustricola]|uniref:Thioredoxin-like protein n=1 Tax=Coniella lustricola TaxID=2025994 RepID=A0A2T3AD27_9PEZI|nr:thioredoxin-like protein [Coniella lustricola]
MKLSSLVWGLLLGAVVHVAGQEEEEEEEIPADYSQEYTEFDGKTVPPMLELTPDNFEKEIKGSKYMLVKHYSPYCPHCQDFAPNFRTLYEFYYTEETPNPSLSFTEYYDWRFAMINCIAYYDLCIKNGVKHYPTSILFEDGVDIGSWTGVKSIPFLTEQIEPVLEKAKPGSRPKTPLLVPKAYDTQRPSANIDSTSSTSSSGTAEQIELRNNDKPLAAAAVAAPAVEELAALRPQEGAAAPAAAKADTVAGSTKADVAKAAAPAPAKAAPAKPTKTPNPNGVSVSLTAESFQTLVTLTQEPWFIKFYAPWCHHCQAMAPSWVQLAKEMEGKLNIGEVNCDVEKRLCKDARLRGYPTILFFRGGERVEYDGLRGIGDFIHYAEKAVELGAGVQEVDATSLETLEAKEEVIFIYFYDHATTTEDFMALERLPLSLIGRAKLVKTKDPVLYERYKITTWPRLLCSREGRPTYYTPLTPFEMRDTHLVLNWMKSVWLPIVPELTASNAREIMDGKIVVLGIINRQDQESFSSAIREMKSAASEWMDKQIQLFQLERQELRDAKQLRIEEAEDRNDQRALRAAKSIHVNMDHADRKEVTFAWVDGVFWQRWIKTTYGIDVKDGERVIINDEDNRRYWDQTSTGNYIIPSRTSILETINKVTAQPPKIKPKLTISSFEKIFFDMRVTFTEHPYLTLGCVAGLLFGALSWFRGRLFGRRRINRLFLNDDFKAPLLGSNANGKTD